MKTYGPGQAALQHALSRYNTGDTNRGIDNGYLFHVMAALKRLAGMPNLKQSNSAQHAGVKSD